MVKDIIYKNLKPFDYANSSYKDFANYLQKVVKQLMEENNYHVLSKSLIISGMGFSNFSRWRIHLTNKKVQDSEIKLWLLNYVLNLQEQNFINLMFNDDIAEFIRINFSKQMGMYYGKQYLEEIVGEDESKVEAFKEKFTINIKGKGILND